MSGPHGVVWKKTQMEMIMKHWIDIDLLIQGDFIVLSISKINIFFCSICENPIEIDARDSYTKIDWRYSNSILINAEIDNKWNIGISRFG